jgi:hypothetical protein
MSHYLPGGWATAEFVCTPVSLSLSLSLLYRIGPHCGRCVMKPSTSDLISHISSDGSLGLFAVIPCDPGPL